MMSSGVSGWLKALFGDSSDHAAEALHGFPPATLAACALLLEVSLADHAEDPEEMVRLKSAMEGAWGISSEAIEALVTMARSHLAHSVSLYEHTRILNADLTPADKIELIRQMWQVAYADGHLDHYEEHLIRRVADLLYVEHRDFMQAKLAVRDDLRSPI